MRHYFYGFPVSVMKEFFATCPKGLENLLADELTTLGAEQVRETVAGVHFKGELAIGYKACLWSRFASRIVLVLSEFQMNDDLDLYLGAHTIPWEEHFSGTSTIAVDFTGTNPAIRNTQYGALKIKDAIVDRFTKRGHVRPDVDKKSPDIRIMAHLGKGKANITLDLSGPALHQRFYRQGTGEAPLKENLACAMIARSGWAGEPMMDPMCGSGTLLIEAAFIAADMAPALRRERFGFDRWLQHDSELWQSLMMEAQVRAKRGMQRCEVKLFGCDADQRVLLKARDNAKAAGVAHLITFKQADVTKLENPLPMPALVEGEEGQGEARQVGMLISNPPYGERLGEFPALLEVHQALGDALRRSFQGWRVSILSASPELLSCLRLRADKQYRLFNGALECQLRNYQIALDSVASQKEVAQDFANRLRKNLKTLEKWANKEGIDCYRLYDADLPEYNAAIDRYQDYLVVQEYAAPKDIPAQKTRQRLLDMVQAAIKVTGMDGEKVILKVRERQEGKQQYQKLSEEQHRMEVQEYGARLWVNLYDYLDTGLFLDHRQTRRMLGQMAKGKRFLNLFAYTGSATVHAGLGGASETTTVDMSHTYLNWAQDNMRLNSLVGRQHKFVQADCLKWLSEADDQYDLIFIDPPTFSNSKRMDESFDVQRDHLLLMQHLKRLLAADGTLVFSNNKRHFKMDLAGLEAIGLKAQNITQKTRPKDFERNQHIHNCWIITHAPEQGEA
ncbi:bifunctional 23S rRNA (guanine(2069)-N(7))-methyltransferase RlmK/23S rRNA (guanine(2445)-N(2))-methyltransferase RlmL [Aeromonas allosaccharophila]|uniref:bifunctional 23S rRNA (guanine(2069)-N(7))-methyltransferase RlmK/23S rRNA (guanine(2445)-N(2))-methyltransferase RlmL n=1 Tax=Aeromonas allosaccharophila TaxID=656 RepID=UPI0038D0D3C4